MDLGGAIARWGGLAVDGVGPGAAHACEDLGWTLWGMHTLGVVPEAAVGASAVAKVSAEAPSLHGPALLRFVCQVWQPSVLWHQLGLVPDLAPAARALAASLAASLPDNCDSTYGQYNKVLTDVMAAAKLPVPASAPIST